MTITDIDNDNEIATEETIEEREQQIVAIYTTQSEIVKSEDEEEAEEPDPVPIPQNSDMKKLRDQLRKGVETKGFPSMEEFDTFAGKITVQISLDKYCTSFCCQRHTVTSVKR